MDLIVCALKEEFYFPDLDILYTSVGKLNACCSLISALKNNKYNRVINLGTAGSSYVPIGSLVFCNQIIDRDFEPKLRSKYSQTIEFENKSPFQSVTCFTGDNFVCKENMGMFKGVVDMEAYALAKVCKEMKIPFMSIKYVSDMGDEDKWEESLNNAQKEFKGILDLILK